MLSLRPYQEAILERLKTMPRAALFLEMGLGKTAIIIRLMQHILQNYGEARFLIIAPPAVACLTYPQELQKWAPNLRYLVINKVNIKKRDEAIKRQDYEVAIISNLQVSYLRSTRLYLLFDGLIVDECSTVFCRHNSTNFAALSSILHRFVFRYIMTGTPLPNNYLQLWSQYFILDNGERLGKKFTDYKRAYFIQNSYRAYQVTPRLGAPEEIKEKVKDITFAMKMRDVAIDLPPIEHSIIPTDLPQVMDKKYKDFKRNYILTCDEGSDFKLHYNEFSSDDLTIIADTSAQLVEKLLQFCSGAVYINSNRDNYVIVHDLKIKALQDIISNHEGKAILLYRYKHEQERILSALKDEVVAYNSKPDLIRKWQAGETNRILMAHPRSIATGLNLQHDADTVIWLGFTWDLQLWQQANARLHRPGQKNPVRCLYIATGEMEYQLLTRLKSKDQALLDFMVDMNKRGLSSFLTTEEEKAC